MINMNKNVHYFICLVLFYSYIIYITFLLTLCKGKLVKILESAKAIV